MLCLLALTNLVCCIFYIYQNGKALILFCYDCVQLFFCWFLLIILFISFLLCPFCCKVSIKWLSSACRYFLSEMINILYKRELIVDCFCADGMIPHAGICLCESIFYISGLLSASLKTSTRTKSLLSSYYLLLYNKYWNVEENYEVISEVPLCQISNHESIVYVTKLIF